MDWLHWPSLLLGVGLALVVGLPVVWCALALMVAARDGN